MTQGERIRELRTALGWSQRYLAERLGLHTHTPVKQWENDQALAPGAVMTWLGHSAAPLTLRPLPEGWVIRE